MKMNLEQINEMIYISRGQKVMLDSDLAKLYGVETKVLNQVEKEFKDVLFLSFEQTKNKDIAQFLKIDYWTTIVIYKDNKETYRSMGVTNKSEIYSAIKSNT